MRKVSLFSFIKNLFRYGKLYLACLLCSDYKERRNTYKTVGNIPLKSKIIIYGFGKYGETVLIDNFFSMEITGIYDKGFDKYYGRKYVKDPDFIDNSSFDFVILTVMNTKSQKSIIEFLKKKNISDRKIIKLAYHVEVSDSIFN